MRNKEYRERTKEHFLIFQAFRTSISLFHVIVQSLSFISPFHMGISKIGIPLYSRFRVATNKIHVIDQNNKTGTRVPVRLTSVINFNELLVHSPFCFRSFLFFHVRTQKRV